MTFQPLTGAGWLLALLLPALAGAVVLAVRSPHPLRRRWSVRAGAVLTLVLLVLGPSVRTTVQEEGGVGIDVFFVVDRTGSMAAEDWAGDAPRLDGVRHDIDALVRALPGARYSILSWDSEAARQLPLTTDARAVTAWTETVQQEITAYSSGSLVDRPLDLLASALEGAAEREPSHLRLVFLASDGEQTAPGTPRSYADLAPLVDGGAVLGYGTAEGGPMRSYDGSLEPDPDRPYIPDESAPVGPDGAPPRAVSRIDEAALRAVAEQLGVPYVHRAGPTDVTPLVAGLDPELVAGGTSERPAWRLVAWPLGLVLLGLLAAETWSTARGWTPLRRGALGWRR